MAVQCPICRKAIPSTSPARETARFLPFCSERCKLADLNAWFDADYRIHASLASDDIDDIPETDE